MAAVPHTRFVFKKVSVHMTGIIIAAHGTSHASAQPERITEAEVRAAYPNAVVQTAYTSRGTPILPQTLADMAQDGIRSAVILPTHIMNGAAYKTLTDRARQFAPAFDTLKILPPLLSDDTGVNAFAQAVRADIAEANEFVLLVGHNTHDTEVYSRLNHALENAYAVDLSTDIDTITRELDRRGMRRLTLAPMFFACGTHASRDAAGVAAALTARGYDMDFSERGIGEYAGVRRIYLKRLAAAIVKV